MKLSHLCIQKQYSTENDSQPDTFVDLENQYYNLKALKEDDPAAALRGFEKVLALEENQGEWGFKALKQMMKLHFKMVGIRCESTIIERSFLYMSPHTPPAHLTLHSHVLVPYTLCYPYPITLCHMTYTLCHMTYTFVQYISEMEW